MIDGEEYYGDLEEVHFSRSESDEITIEEIGKRLGLILIFLFILFAFIFFTSNVWIGKASLQKFLVSENPQIQKIEKIDQNVLFLSEIFCKTKDGKKIKYQINSDFLYRYKIVD